MIGFRRRIEKLEAKMAVRSAQEPEEFVIVQVETREEAVASLDLSEVLRQGTADVDWDVVPMQQSKPEAEFEVPMRESRPGREFALACDVFAAAKRY